MTDNEETRSYNDILKDNEDLTREVENLKAYNRSRPYQTAGQVAAIDVEFARFLLERASHYYWAGLDASSLEQLLQRAIKAWKAQQDND